MLEADAASKENYSDDQKAAAPPCIGKSSAEELRQAVADEVARNSPLNELSRNSKVFGDRRKRRHVNIDGRSGQRHHGQEDRQPERKITLESCYARHLLRRRENRMSRLELRERAIELNVNASPPAGFHLATSWSTRMVKTKIALTAALT
jgi:hypothetical protein